MPNNLFGWVLNCSFWRFLQPYTGKLNEEKDTDNNTVAGADFDPIASQSHDARIANKQRLDSEI